MAEVPRTLLIRDHIIMINTVLWLEFKLSHGTLTTNSTSNTHELISWSIQWVEGGREIRNVYRCLWQISFRTYSYKTRLSTFILVQIAPCTSVSCNTSVTFYREPHHLYKRVVVWTYLSKEKSIERAIARFLFAFHCTFALNFPQ